MYVATLCMCNDSRGEVVGLCMWKFVSLAVCPPVWMAQASLGFSEFPMIIPWPYAQQGIR